MASEKPRSAARAVPALLPLLLLATALAGCDAVPPEYERHWLQFKKELSALQVVLTGGSSPLAKASPAPSPSVSPSPGAEEEFSSQNARNAKANAELLQEVYRVVFLREPKDRGEFGSLVDSLNQGASLEGVYNGFTHSSEYRKLELAAQGSTPGALKAFGEELARLEIELPAPTEFGASASQPLPLPVQPGADPAPSGAEGVSVADFGKLPPAGGIPVSSPSPSVPADPSALAEKYSKQFVGASIFTLKRVLGDEALRVMAAKKEYPEKLAQWYSQWVARIAGRNIDFGIAQRNRADEAFHYQWALTAPEDRLRWEVLNRLHRVLNEANRPRQ